MLGHDSTLMGFVGGRTQIFSRVLLAIGSTAAGSWWKQGPTLVEPAATRPTAVGACWAPITTIIGFVIGARPKKLGSGLKSDSTNLSFDRKTKQLGTHLGPTLFGSRT